MKLNDRPLTGRYRASGNLDFAPCPEVGSRGNFETALRNSDAIPERMAQFLSLEALDTNQVQIQTFVGNNSARNLSPLISYISSQRGHDFSALVAALKDVDQ